MLFEKLSENDIDLIQTYIECYGPNHNSEVYFYHEKPLSHILRIWDETKSEYLYNLLGQQFILEKHITYKIPIERVRGDLANNIARGEMATFNKKFKEYINMNFDFSSDMHWQLRQLTDTETLAYNSIRHLCGDSSAIIQFSEDFSIKLQIGMKPLKALKKIASFLNLETEFEQFRLAHSRILNQKSLDGNLCLSIHPLDYLTMSENASKWTSCMNWTEPGCYRMGTVEMMNSPMVVIAYLKSENRNYHFAGNKEWNDKHWRILLIVTKEGIISVKGYPYANPDLTKMCIEWLAKLANENLGWEYYPVDVIKEDKEFIYAPNQHKYDIVTETAQMYNDFGATEHFGALEVLDDDTDITFYKFHYSGPTECLICGNTSNTYYDESYVFCDNCCSYGDEENCSTCDRCGRYWNSDEVYWFDDACYCPDCVDEVGARCEIEGEWDYYENLTPIYLAQNKDDPNPEEDDKIYVRNQYALAHEGKHKYSLFTYTKNWFNIEYPRVTDNGICYLNYADITESGLHSYGLYGKYQQEYFNYDVTEKN